MSLNENKNADVKEAAEKKPLNKGLIIGIASAVVVLIASIAIFFSSAGWNRPVTFSDVVGNLSVSRNGVAIAVNDDYKFVSGDRISTVSGSSVNVLIDDNKNLNLSENTDITLFATGTKSAENICVDFGKGKMSVSVNGAVSKQSSFVIRTSDAAVSFNEAQLFVYVGPEIYRASETVTRIDVISGSATIASAGTKTEYTGGQTFYLRGDGILSGTTANVDRFLADEEEENVKEDDRIAYEAEWAKYDTDLSSASVGQIVYLGRYEQDGNIDNGKEPLRWIVLENDNNQVVLISYFILEAMAYNNEDARVTWETCSLRTWLNDEFYNTAFVSCEQDKIVLSEVSNPDSYAFFDEFYEAGTNTIGVTGGNATSDYVYLLSYDELLNYYDAVKLGNGWWKYVSDSFQIKATIASGLENYEFLEWDYNMLTQTEENWPEECIGKLGATWWLRSPGDARNTALNISEYGYLTGGSYVDEVMGVRPVICVAY